MAGPSGSDEHEELLSAAAGMTTAINGLRAEIGGLQVYGRRNRHLIKVVAVSVAFDVGLSFGLGWAALKAQHASAAAKRASSTLVVGCVSTNASNEIQRKLWGTLFTFPPPVNETSAEKAQRIGQTATFKSYIETAFAPQDCTKLATR